MIALGVERDRPPEHATERAAGRVRDDPLPRLATPEAAIAVQRAIGNRAFATLIGAGGQRAGRTMLQRVWQKTDQPGIEKWHEAVQGRIWFYNRQTKKYYYEPEEGAQPPEGADEDWETDLDKYKGKEKPFHYCVEWMTDDMRHKEDPLSQTTKESATKPEPATDPVVEQHHLTCLTALFTDNAELLRKPLAIMLNAKGDPEGKLMRDLSETVRRESIDILRAHHKWKWTTEKKGDETEEEPQEKSEGIQSVGSMPARLRFGDESQTFVDAQTDGNDAKTAGGAILMLYAAVQRAAFRHLGDYIEVEEGFNLTTGGYEPKPMAETLQLQEHHENYRGLWLHFTRRTKAPDVRMVKASCDQLAMALARGPDEMAVDMLKNLGTDFNAALDVLTKTTGAKGSWSTARETSETARNSVKYEHLVAHWTQVVAAWQNAMKAGTIHVVFDRASLADAFGYSSPSEATPETLMKGDARVFEKGQRIVVNLDSQKESAEVVVTLAHELAHALGFNPTGMDPEGHFVKDVTRYEEAEATYGSKLLFDAYYFETIIKRLTDS